MINTFRAIRNKQIIDMAHNKKAIVGFFLLPVIYIILNLIEKEDGIQSGALFVTMHCVLVPIMLSATQIAEEKDKGTLRFLMLSGVRAGEYIAGFLFMMIGGMIMSLLVFELAGAFADNTSALSIIIMFLSVGISFMLGIIIGRLAENQMSVSAIAIPVVLVIFFLSMIGMVTESWKNVSGLLYAGVMMKGLAGNALEFKDAVFFASNFIIVLVVLIFVFNRKSIIKSLNSK